MADWTIGRTYGGSLNQKVLGYEQNRMRNWSSELISAGAKSALQEFSAISPLQSGTLRKGSFFARGILLELGHFTIAFIGEPFFSHLSFMLCFRTRLCHVNRMIA